MSLPKFNLSKLKEAVSRQQKVTRQDIRNLLLLDRLRSDVTKQRTKSKSRNVGNYDYKVTIRGFDYKWMGSDLAFTIEFKRRVGEDDFIDMDIELYEESYETLESIIQNQDSGIDPFDKDPFADEGVDADNPDHYLESEIQPSITQVVISSTLNDNLKRFEVRHFMKDKDVNSWSTGTTEGNDLFNISDSRYWDHISHNYYDSIDIERL